MIVYIDSEFRCHITNSDGIYREVETDFFDDKCVAFIEGYRYIPEGETWTRPDEIMFSGEMISPWKNYSELDATQREYEQQIVIEHNQVLQELGVEVNS